MTPERWLILLALALIGLLALLPKPKRVWTVCTCCGKAWRGKCRHCIVRKICKIRD